MSDYGFYLERARKASAMLSAMEVVAERNPSDLVMRINVASAQKLAASAERELSSVAAAAQIDLCRYRLIVPENVPFSVMGVSSSLGEFQEVFTFVYDALTDSPKRVARLPRNRYQETALEFGYTFAGSLGVVLMAPGRLSLFGEGKFDGTLDAINAVFDIRDGGELRDLAHRIGRAAIQKIYEWSHTNYSSGFSVDLKWTTPSTIHKGRYLEWRQFERVTSLIGMTSDTESVDISVQGSLVGFGSLSRTFHFVEPDGESYRGQLAETFPAAQEWTVNHSYQAEIAVETIIKLATGEDVRRFKLKFLKELPSSP